MCDGKEDTYIEKVQINKIIIIGKKKIKIQLFTSCQV